MWFERHAPTDSVLVGATTNFPLRLNARTRRSTIRPTPARRLSPSMPRTATGSGPRTLRGSKGASRIRGTAHVLDVDGQPGTVRATLRAASCRIAPEPRRRSARLARLPPRLPAWVLDDLRVPARATAPLEGDRMTGAATSMRGAFGRRSKRVERTPTSAMEDSMSVGFEPVRLLELELADFRRRSFGRVEDARLPIRPCSFAARHAARRPGHRLARLRDRPRSPRRARPAEIRCRDRRACDGRLPRAHLARERGARRVAGGCRAA
jgi:hypothetical protein